MTKKKGFITLLVAMIIGTTLLTGCDETTQTITSTETQTQTVVGSYSLFRTRDVQKYLSFLENFDETKYKIADISTSMDTGYNGSGEFYMVTYKTIK